MWGNFTLPLFPDDKQRKGEISLHIPPRNSYLQPPCIRVFRVEICVFIFRIWNWIGIGMDWIGFLDWGFGDSDSTPGRWVKVR